MNENMLGYTCRIKKLLSTQSITFRLISYFNRRSLHQDHYNALIINTLILNTAITSTYTSQHFAKGLMFLIYPALSIVSPLDSMDEKFLEYVTRRFGIECPAPTSLNIRNIGL